MEVWKKVIGFEGCYEISDLGNVRSLDRYVSYKTKLGKDAKIFVKGQTMKHRVAKDGYLIIELQKNGGRYMSLVHRLLYAAFVNPDIENKDIDHKDGDRSNLSIDNLRECKRVNNLTYKNVNRNRKTPYVGIKRAYVNKKGVQKWIAQIWDPKNKKAIRSKRFNTAEEAHEEYCRLRKIYYNDDIKLQE